MLVVSAGMPRSASTWLFNLIWLLLENKYPNRELVAGWVKDIDCSALDPSAINLIKVHEFDETLSGQADIVIYSYRDIRDALASLERKFDVKPSIALAENLLKQDYLWREQAQCVMKYEGMLDARQTVIKLVGKTLNLKVSSEVAEQIQHRLHNLAFEQQGRDGQSYDQTMLYHQGHITLGRRYLAGATPA